MREKINEMLTELRLGGMAEALDGELDRAEREGTAACEVIARLLTQEYNYRQERSLAYRIKQAKIPWDWSLRTFPFDKQPGISKPQIQALAELSFIERAENIVFIGSPGTGKSGLASGLLRKALLAGYRGRFYNTQDLLDELYASLADHCVFRSFRPPIPNESGHLSERSDAGLSLCTLVADLSQGFKSFSH